MALRRPFDPVRPVQTGIEPLRRIRRADLTREHRAHLIVVGAGIVFRVEIAVLVGPIRPGAGETVEDLPRIVLMRELAFTRQLGQRHVVRYRAPQPLWDAVLGNRAQTRRDPRLAEILLREDVNGDLTPVARDHAVLRFKNKRAVRIRDPGGPRHEPYARIRVTRT